MFIVMNQLYLRIAYLPTGIHSDGVGGLPTTLPVNASRSVGKFDLSENIEQ